MKFGIIILTVIMLISIAGSLIQQNQEPMYYVRTYPQMYKVILALKLNNVFNSWYFNLLVIFLTVNLTLCSIIRFSRVRKDEELSSAGKAFSDIRLDENEKEAVRKQLKNLHCSVRTSNGREIYYKNRIGRYGTFITHLGILLTVIFFALALHAPKVMDQTCYPGDSLKLDDGTVIKVNDFQIEDADGTLNYKSQLEVVLPDGRSSGVKETSVNHPLSFGTYKVYQQTYGTAGRISVSDQDGNKDTFVVDEQMFLTKDQKNGILFNALYPDIVVGEDGDYTLITATTGTYPNPVYTFNLVEEGEKEGTSKMTPMLAFPGDTIDVRELTFTFEKPLEYPGLRIKKSPAYVNGLLLFGFAVMIVGFFMTFFLVPVLVVIDDKGYRILGTKTEGIRLQLEAVLRKEKEKHNA